MPCLDDNFRNLMYRVRAGSEEAARELVAQYGDTIRQAVRESLHVTLRPRFDSLDFVQIVWKSFFSSPDDLSRFDSPDELVAFLVAAARNKVRIEARRLMADRTVLRRVLTDDNGHPRDLKKIADRQPEPMEVAIAREQLECIVQAQPVRFRPLVRMRLQGHTYEEIGAAFRLDKGIVRRVLHRLLGQALAGRELHAAPTAPDSAACATDLAKSP